LAEPEAGLSIVPVGLLSRTNPRHQASAIQSHAAAVAPPHQPCASRAGAAISAPAGEVVVDVEGKVAHPGVETLPAGSRVYEALAAAGGALPGVDASALDLARPVSDGEQLRVGIAGAPAPVVGVPEPAPGAGKRGKRGRPSEPVNLNTATLEQLETVPDVGPAMAQRILDWRMEHGRFETVSQLRQVRGIGDRKFAEMRDSVTV
jgi:competence protein ComEA